MKRLFIVAAAVAAAAMLAACQPKMQEPLALPDLATPSTAPATPSAAPSLAPTESPTPAPVVVTTSPTPSPKPECPSGPFQLQVEQAIEKLGGFGKIVADGKQTEEDCKAIKAFQKRFDVRPYDGVPGPDTNSVAQRLASTNTAECNAKAELTACVDLTHQTTYLMQDGKLIWGPTVTRTGYNTPDGQGSPTPSGSYKIIERQYKDWTETFKTYLYYWQRIMGDNGFHKTTTYINDLSLGSHGCVNLLEADAVKYWDSLKVGTSVQVYGRRPGT